MVIKPMKAQDWLYAFLISSGEIHLNIYKGLCGVSRGRCRKTNVIQTFKIQH